MGSLLYKLAALRTAAEVRDNVGAGKVDTLDSDTSDDDDEQDESKGSASPACFDKCKDNWEEILLCMGATLVAVWGVYMAVQAVQAIVDKKVHFVAHFVRRLPGWMPGPKSAAVAILVLAVSALACATVGMVAAAAAALLIDLGGGDEHSPGPSPTGEGSSTQPFLALDPESADDAATDDDEGGAGAFAANKPPLDEHIVNPDHGEVGALTLSMRLSATFGVLLLLAELYWFFLSQTRPRVYRVTNLYCDLPKLFDIPNCSVDNTSSNSTAVVPKKESSSSVGPRGSIDPDTGMFIQSGPQQPPPEPQPQPGVDDGADFNGSNLSCSLPHVEGADAEKPDVEGADEQKTQGMEWQLTKLTTSYFAPSQDYATPSSSSTAPSPSAASPRSASSSPTARRLVHASAAAVPARRLPPQPSDLQEAQGYFQSFGTTSEACRHLREACALPSRRPLTQACVCSAQWEATNVSEEQPLYNEEHIVSSASKSTKAIDMAGGGYCGKWSAGAGQPWCFVHQDAKCKGHHAHDCLSRNGNLLYRSTGPCTERVESRSQYVLDGFSRAENMVHVATALGVVLLALACCSRMSLSKSLRRRLPPRQPSAARAVAPLQVRDLPPEVDLEPQEPDEADEPEVAEVLMEPPSVEDQLEALFAEAQEQVTRKLTDSHDEQLRFRLYGLYKQATEGNVKGERPGPLKKQSRARYDTWARLRGLSKEQAIEEYIKTVALIE